MTQGKIERHHRSMKNVGGTEMPPSLRARPEGALAWAAANLPPAVQRLLAGGHPVRIDDQELAPDVQLALRMLRLSGHRGLDTMTPAAAREELARKAAVFAGRLALVARIERITLPGPAGPLEARLYVPRGEIRRRPLLVYYHGGG